MNTYTVKNFEFTFQEQNGLLYLADHRLQIDGSHDEHIPLLIGDVYKNCVSVVIYLIYNYFNNNDKTLHTLGTLTSLLNAHMLFQIYGFSYGHLAM